METEYKYNCECNNCSYKSNDFSNFRRHQSNKHNYSRDWTTCKICNLRLGTYKGLMTHNSTFHATPEEKARKKALRAARNKRYQDSLNSKVS